MNEILINSVVGFSFPITAYTCDVYNNQCVFTSEINTVPTYIQLPSQFDTAPAVGLKLVDPSGCEKFETITCAPFGCVKPLTGLTQYLLISQYQCGSDPIVYLTGNSYNVCVLINNYSITGCTYGGIITQVESINVGQSCYPPYTYDCDCLIPDGTYILNDQIYSPFPPYTAVTVNSCVITQIDYC